MLRHIRILGFKSLKDVHLDLGLINVLIGPNRSGKSSILQALATLKQSLNQERLITEGPLINIGPFPTILTSGGVSEIVIHLSGTEYISSDERRLVGPVNYDYEVVLNPYLLAHKATISTASQKIEGEFRREPPIEKVSPRSIERGQVKVDLVVGTRVGFPLDVVVGYHPGGYEYEKLFLNLREELEHIVNVIFKCIDSFFLIPALRGLDNVRYSLIGYNDDDLISSAGLTKQNEYACNLLTYRRELEPKLSEWTKRITGAEIFTKVEPPTLTAIKSREEGVEPYLVNDGFGLNQLVHLLLQWAISPKGSTIGIEEPEIHLHPRSQAELASILVEEAVKEKKQLIITTHSEHILMRLLTMVAKGILKPEDLHVYYFEKEGGVTKASRLTVNERGQLEGGLKGFFEAELDNLKEYLEALKG